MLSRRNFGACAICAIAGFAATGVTTEAEAQTPGFKRTILQKTELADTKYVTVLVSVEIDPGAVVARHTHPGIESAYLMEGEAELFVQGQPARNPKADGFQIAPDPAARATATGRASCSSPMLSTKTSRSRRRHRSERINLFAGSMRGAADDQKTTAPPHNAARRLTRQRQRRAANERSDVLASKK